MVVGVTVTSTKRAATDCSGVHPFPVHITWASTLGTLSAGSVVVKRIWESVTVAAPPVPNIELLAIRLLIASTARSVEFGHAVELGGAGNRERVGALLKLRLQAHVAPAIERQQ